MNLPISAGSYDLLAAYAPLATRYLGIGVQEGVCVEHVVRANPWIPVVLCDTWGPHHGGTNRGSHHHVEARLLAAGHQAPRTYLTGPSAEEIPDLGPYQMFDLIYVDGDHAEPAAFTDLKNTWPLLREGGVLLLHDVKMPPVWSALLRWLDTVTDVHRVHLYVGGHGTVAITKRYAV